MGDTKLTKIKNKGFALVELIISVSILAVFIATIVAVNIFYAKIAFGKGDLIKASFLAEEGIEAVKFLRSISWNSQISPLVLEQPYFLNWNSGTLSWTVSAVPDMIDNFERKVVFSEVYRDMNDDITTDMTSGPVLDPNTKLVTVSVGWFDGTATTTKTIKAYVTNIFEN